MAADRSLNAGSLMANDDHKRPSAETGENPDNPDDERDSAQLVQHLCASRTHPGSHPGGKH